MLKLIDSQRSKPQEYALIRETIVQILQNLFHYNIKGSEEIKFAKESSCKANEVTGSSSGNGSNNNGDDNNNGTANSNILRLNSNDSSSSSSSTISSKKTS